MLAVEFGMVDATGNATRDKLREMLMIALPSVTCGGQTRPGMELFERSKDEFLRRFMTRGTGKTQLRHRAPQIREAVPKSHD